MKLQTENNYLKNIFFITLPDDTIDSIGDFKLDKNKKLPIETDDINTWNPEELTWEMIMSAMLKILAYDKNNEDLDYYRNFIFTVRPNIINELTDSGIVKSKDKQFELAEEIFLAILGLRPEDDRNILNLAVLYEDKATLLEQNGNLNESEEVMNQANEYYNFLLNQDSVLNDVYFNAGYFYIKLKDFNKAEECFKSFIEFSDNEDKINQAKEILSNYKNLSQNNDLFNRAYKAILNDDESTCISLMSKLVEDDPNIWNAWFLLGWAYRRLSNFTEATRSLEKALELNRSDADIYNELSICYMEIGDYNKSQESLEKALSITPEDVKIISNMGIIELKRGNRDRARNFFETVLVLSPEDNIAKQYLDII